MPVAESRVLPPPSTGQLAERLPLSESNRPAIQAASRGRLPELSLIGACGLLLVAVADNGARTGTDWAGPLFWAGLLVLFVPIAARLFSQNAARTERLWLVAGLGLGLYAVKLLHSPLDFTFYDELQHWRSASDIVQGRRLFEGNSLLPVSPFFPGLEIVTSALVSVAGLSIFQAGAILVGTARLLLVLTLYLLYERVAHSPRVAGVATLVYMANPNFVFFGAQFAYESLALPLAALTLFAIAGRSPASTTRRLGLTLLALFGLATVAITHHLTAYALSAFLVVWAVVGLVGRRRRAADEGPAGAALLALVLSLSWLLYVATLVIGYLAPNLARGLSELVGLITGEATGRQLFRSFSGQHASLPEQLTGYASVALILLALPPGLRRVWQRHRHDTLALALGCAAIAYPASLALRLTTRGAELSNRSSEFLFLAVGFVVAVALAESWETPRPRWRLRSVLTAWTTVIFMGGVIVGWGPWARLPGSYMVAADMRSIEPQGLATATWARTVLGPGHRVAADRVNRLLLGTYGEQHALTTIADKLNVGSVFLARELGAPEWAALRAAATRYVVVDQRLTWALPAVGVYFEQGEPGTFGHTTPLDPVILAKFDGIQHLDRIYDSGDIAIFDVGALSDAP